MSEMLCIDTGSEFQADGPATEKVCSPRLVESRWDRVCESITRGM